jgi:formylglycine-generating enzyme required for sulfatase activity
LDKGFFAARTPVTNAQYARFVEKTKHKAPERWKGRRPPEKLARHPVVNVTWHDAAAYAEWASARLPTEEEWDRVKISLKHREGGQNSRNLLLLSSECAKGRQRQTGRHRRPQANLTWLKSNQQASRELPVPTW